MRTGPKVQQGLVLSNIRLKPQAIFYITQATDFAAFSRDDNRSVIDIRVGKSTLTQTLSQRNKSSSHPLYHANRVTSKGIHLYGLALEGNTAPNKRRSGDGP